MDDKKPNTTEKIVLPKSLQREMIKFFARCIPVTSVPDKDSSQQAPEIPKKGVLTFDKHSDLRSCFHRGAGTRGLLNPSARGKITKLRKT